MSGADRPHERISRPSTWRWRPQERRYEPERIRPAATALPRQLRDHTRRVPRAEAQDRGFIDDAGATQANDSRLKPLLRAGSRLKALLQFMKLTMSGPLTGVKILEITRVVLGPLGLPDAGRHGRRGHQDRAALGRQQPLRSGALSQHGHGGAVPRPATATSAASCST